MDTSPQTTGSTGRAGFEIGLYTFGEIIPDPLTGRTMSAQQRLQEMIAAAKLADEAGLDVFGVGEHHTLEFAVSATPVVLAAIAQATKRIKLTSATTVLSTSDPVRLFEDFATVDLLSDGRAEIMAGRGAFIESFPLFGYEIDDYHKLFAEKIELLLELNSNERVTWSGQFRSALHDAEIAPRPARKELPIWIGVGGTPESAARAGRLGKGMAMAILGGDPGRFKPFVDIYRTAGVQSRHRPEELKVAVSSHGFIAETTQQAKDEFFPYYANYFGHFLGKRTGRGPVSRAEFDHMAHPGSALAVGSPEQIVEKLLRQYELFGHNRFMAQMDVGGTPFSKLAKAIELLATKVAPVVRRETSK
ncbi:LLM class flavin-dependent oxidoreductase [uncultured Paenibacillus sp.]|uniref:LLM class flavin-dependent oxidoreductase n=1 Tax=uncultured Paenibacillus sp. TaxID=227322 RepID=UPI0028D4558A|nr:LLM class flavin-dependent oxidoreductase [uncultured Paenibacillus sp.]